MNYLAHAFLSFHDNDLIIGNLITDFIIGKEKLNYSEGIQKGIERHYQIDRFTDSHEVTRDAKLLLKSLAGKYASVFLDIVYDHFLASDETLFSAQSLEEFAQYVYRLMDANAPILPEKFMYMFGYMKQYNWLYSYRSTEGIYKAFLGMSRRAKFLTEEDGEAIFQEFLQNYEGLKLAYQKFMPEMIAKIQNP